MKSGIELFRYFCFVLVMQLLAVKYLRQLLLTFISDKNTGQFTTKCKGDRVQAKMAIHYRLDKHIPEWK